jgi:hypothetical protein
MTLLRRASPQNWTGSPSIFALTVPPRQTIYLRRRI